MTRQKIVALVGIGIFFYEILREVFNLVWDLTESILLYSSFSSLMIDAISNYFSLFLMLLIFWIILRSMRNFDENTNLRRVFIKFLLAFFVVLVISVLHHSLIRLIVPDSYFELYAGYVQAFQYNIPAIQIRRLAIELPSLFLRFIIMGAIILWQIRKRESAKIIS